MNVRWWVVIDAGLVESVFKGMGGVCAWGRGKGRKVA
jgi:cell shape-determining protein MreC